MDDQTARTVLAVGPDATADDLRRAYREQLRRHHPDVSADPDAADRTRRLTTAYRTLTARAPHAVDRPSARADGGTITIEAPPDEAFLLLAAAADALGDVTYVDPEAGLLEVRLAFEGGGTASLVVSLQGRAATGTTDAFCSLTDLGTGPVADVTAVAEFAVEHLNAG